MSHRWHRLNLLGTVHAAKYADLGIGFFANAGAPYTVMTGRDDYRDGYANARPAGVPRNSREGAWVRGVGPPLVQ